MNDNALKFPHLYGRQLYDAELSVASHYMHLPTAPLQESPIRPHHFECIPLLGELWERGLEMEAEGKKAELTAFVMDEASGRYFDLVDTITDHVIRRGSTSMIGRLENQIIEAATLRMLRAAVSDIHLDIGDQNMGVDEVLTAFEGLAKRAREQRPELEIQTLGDAIDELAHKTVEAAEEGKIIGLPMPLPTMQDRLGGWRPGRMHIIAGITSGHKSTVLRMSLEHMAAEGFPTLLVSYEDPNADFAGRSLVAQPGSEFTTTQIMNADFGPEGQRSERLAQFMRQVDSSPSRKIPMYVWDKPMLVDELISFLYRATRQHKLRAIGIDFLQLIRANDSRVDVVAHLDQLANRLQGVAKDLNIALLVAAQPTQSATNNATKNNTAIGLSDVKGASAISQACFGLLTLHFPMDRIKTESSKSGMKYTDVEYERVPNRIMIVTRKWKSGSVTGAMTFHCDGAHDRITELEAKKFYGTS